MLRPSTPGPAPDVAAPLALLPRPDRPVVLIGLMGVGKTTIGRRLAQELSLPFVDADNEIEKAADRTIAEIFADFGEREFRDGEERVIARLMSEPPAVIATGGGAFMREATRKNILQQGHAVWLRAEVDTLLERTARRGNRPLLNVANPRAVLERLAAERDPLYAQAPFQLWSDQLGLDGSVRAIIDWLRTLT